MGIFYSSLFRWATGWVPAAEERYLLPGWNTLGCGYDVLNGFYADTRSCKFTLFNFPQELDDLEPVQVVPGNPDSVYLKPKSIVYRSNFTTNLYTSAGTDIESYSTQVSNKTKVDGSYNFFSASVASDFGKSTVTNNELEFSKVHFDVGLFTLQLPNRAKDEFLDPVVRADIDGAQDLFHLFDNYGTHYLAGLVMGGRATYSSTTNKYRFTSNTDLGTVAEMSYKTLVGSISAQEELRYKEDVARFNQNSSSRLETVGGDSALGGQAFPKDPKAWASSVGNWLALADFQDGGLLGIWTLASTPERVQQLLEFYPTYCQIRETRYTRDPGPYLRARIENLNNIMYTDRGGGAKNDLSVCIPDPSEGWYILGQVALPGMDQKGGGTLLVREISGVSGALAEVSSWQNVWTDAGSGKSKDYNLWRGLARESADYRVLSDFFRGGVSNQDPPTAEETRRIRAVRNDCLVKGVAGQFVWSDRGTNATKDASIWAVLPEDPDQAIPYANIKPYYVSTDSHQAPTWQNRNVYCLKRSAVVFDSQDLV